MGAAEMGQGPLKQAGQGRARGVKRHMHDPAPAAAPPTPVQQLTNSWRLGSTENELGMVPVKLLFCTAGVCRSLRCWSQPGNRPVPKETCIEVRVRQGACTSPSSPTPSAQSAQGQSC